MSIRLLDSFIPSDSPQAATASGAKARADASLQPDTQDVNQPTSGTGPERQTLPAQRVSSTYELPQDEVEMHQDPDVKGQIIIDYLDQAKNIVVQVPSSEELNVERGIAQELQDEAKRASHAAVSGTAEVKTYGD
jgi:hypothetical protein